MNICCDFVASYANGYNLTVNCSDMNGGCQYTCFTGQNGNPDYCGCPIGLTLSSDGYDCYGEWLIQKRSQEMIFTDGIYNLGFLPLDMVTE